MSVVTNIILQIGTFEEEDEVLAFINEYEEIKKTIPFKIIDTENTPIAGSKNIEAYICIGAFNYFSLDKFLKYLNNPGKFRAPEDFQVFVRTQEEECFKEVDVFI